MSLADISEKAVCAWTVLKLSFLIADIVVNMGVYIATGKIESGGSIMTEYEDMVYLPFRISPRKIAEGSHKGLSFYVLNFGTHPCAYVDVSDTPLSGELYHNISIDCHGGLTYSGTRIGTVDKSGWFIGWDYAHYGDFVGYLTGRLVFSGKLWSVEEIVKECKYVIEQVLEMSYNG